MTDAQDRVAQLQARRAAAAGNPTPATTSATRPTGTRRSTATGSKIAAAGVGMTVMFGLVGAMALAQNRGSSTPQPVQSTAPAQVVVVIHRDGGTAAQTAGASSKPIQLAAQPVVRQAPAQAPAAKTRGSR